MSSVMELGSSATEESRRKNRLLKPVWVFLLSGLGLICFIGLLSGKVTVCRTAGCNKTAKLLLDSLNTNVDPCTDFYEYSCGSWIAKNPIPPQLPEWSHFKRIKMQSNVIAREILNEPMSTWDPPSLNEAKDFYTACSDDHELDQVGLVPLFEILLDYGGWPLLSKPGQWNSSSFDWMKSMADLKRLFGISALLEISISQYHKNAIAQKPSFFLLSPYLLDRVEYGSYVGAYKMLIVNIAKELKRSSVIKEYEQFAGNPSSEVVPNYLEEMAEDIIDFETQLAVLLNKRLVSKSGFGNAGFDHVLPKSEIAMILDYVFLTSGAIMKEPRRIWIFDRNYFTALFELISNTTHQTLANYLHFRILASLVSATTNAMRLIRHEYNNEILGVTTPTSRVESCAILTIEKFGFALGGKYLERTKVNLPAVDKVTRTMTKEVRQSLQSLLFSQSVRMEDFDRETLNGYYLKDRTTTKGCIGYPPWMTPNGNDSLQNTYNDKLESHFDKLDIGNRGYIEKLLKVQRWMTDQEFGLLNKRSKFQLIPECKWSTFPGTTFAHFSPEKNLIYIPVSLFQYPFFSVDIPRSLNYGGMGCIMGHELTHELQYHYPYTGMGEESLNKLKQCFVHQYNKIQIYPSLYVNGAKTLEENFADNGALLMAYLAYKNQSNSLISDDRLPGLEHLNNDQLFFLGYASSCCADYRPKLLLQKTFDGVHAPEKQRVIGTLRNSKEFASSWNCPLGSPMNPEAKCNVF